jgi:hypothetical protein
MDLTFRRRYIWPANISVSEVIFFISRYIAFIVTLGLIYGALEEVFEQIHGDIYSSNVSIVAS